jgi:hypothetical protein
MYLAGNANCIKHAGHAARHHRRGFVRGTMHDGYYPGASDSAFINPKAIKIHFHIETSQAFNTQQAWVVRRGQLFSAQH